MMGFGKIRPPPAARRPGIKRPQCYTWGVFYTAVLFSPFLLLIGRILPENAPFAPRPVGSGSEGIDLLCLFE